VAKRKKLEVLVTTCHGKSGARQMRKTLVEKFGCKIVKEPYYDEKRGMWKIEYTDEKLSGRYH